MTSSDVPTLQIEDPQDPKLGESDVPTLQMGLGQAESDQIDLETQQRRMRKASMDFMRQFREEHPVRAALGDTIDVIGGAASAVVQSGAIDVVTGAHNLFSADNNQWDFKLKEHLAGMRTEGGPNPLEAIEGTQSKAVAGARHVADFIGWGIGTFGTGGIGEVGAAARGGSALMGILRGRTIASMGYGGATKLFEAGAKTFGANAKTAGWIGRAGGLGLLEFERNSGPVDERLTNAAFAAATVPIFEGATAVVKRLLMGFAAKGAMTAEHVAVDSYASKKGMFVRPNETPNQFTDRVTQAWVADGTPGLSKNWRSMLADLGEHGAQGLTLSLLDQEFRSKEFDLIKDGKWAEAAQFCFEKTLTNTLGLAATKFMVEKWSGQAAPDETLLNWGLRQPDGAVRISQETVEKTAAREMAQEAAAEGKPVPAAKPAKPKAETKEEKAAREKAEAKAKREQDKFWNPLGEKQKLSNEEGLRQENQAAIDKAVSQIPPDLERLGVEPLPGEQIRPAPDEGKTGGAVEIVEPGVKKPETPKVEPRPGIPAADEAGYSKHSYGGTDLTFEIRGDKVVPSEKLARRMGIEGEMPKEDFFRRMEQQALLDLYTAKWILPGDTHYIGVTVEPSTDLANQPSQLHTVRGGRHYTKDNLAEAKWSDSGEAKPMREPDPVGEEQLAAATELNLLRADFGPPNDPALLDVLDAMDYALRHVDAKRDQSLGNLVQMLNSGASRELLASSAPVPGGADNAFMQIAHGGASKDPMLAMQSLSQKHTTSLVEDLGRERTAAQLQEAEGVQSIKTSVGEAGSLRKLLGESSPVSERLREIVDSGKAGDLEIEASVAAKAADYMRRQAPKRPESERKQMESFFQKASKAFGVNELRYDLTPEGAAVRDEQRGMMGPGGYDPSKVIGLTPGDMFAPIKKSVETMLDASGESVVDNTAKDLISKVADRGAREPAQRLRHAIQNKVEYEKRTYDDIEEIRTLAKANKRDMHDLNQTVQDGEGSRYTVAQLEADMDVRARAEESGLTWNAPTGNAAKIMEAHDRIRFKTGEMAEDAGMVNERGDKITADVERKRPPRMWTPEFAEAVLRKSGSFYDALVREIGIVNEMGPEQVQDMLTGRGVVAGTEGRGVAAKNAMEISRKIKVIPAEIKVGDQWVKVLETNPFRWAKSIIERTASRAGFVKEFGPDRGLTESEAGQVEGFSGSMPVTAMSHALDVQKAHGTEAARAFVDAVRAVHGLPLEMAPFQSSPGDSSYKIGQLFSMLTSVWRTLKLQRAGVPNLTELLGQAHAKIGTTRVIPAMTEVFKSLFSGDYFKMVDSLARDGLLQHQKMEPGIESTTTLEAMTQGVKTFAEWSSRLTGFHWIQQFNEVSVARAAQRFVEDLQGKKGDSVDRIRLKAMRYGGETLDSLMNGTAAPQLYNEVARRLVVETTGGSARTGAEKSRSLHSKVFTALVPFQGFATAYASNVAGALRTFRSARGADKAAAGKLLGQYMIAMGVSTAAATSLLALFRDGTEGVEQLGRRAAENPGDAAMAFLGSASQNFLGIQGLLGGKWEILDNVGALSIGREVAMFGQAMAEEAPAKDTPYDGLSHIERLEKFMGRLSPLANDLLNGPLGLQLPLIGLEDPKVANALGSFYQWKRDNKESLGSGSGEGTEFSQAMSRVSQLMKEGKKAGDPEVRTALREASKAESWDKVHSSLQGKKVLADYASDKKKLASIRRTLGEDQFHVLQAYDRTIDRLADWTKR